MNVAAYAQAARLFCTAIRRLHDVRAAAGHDGIAVVSEGGTQVMGQLVILMVFVEAGGAEYGDTGPREVETLETAQELKEDSYSASQISLATTSPRQEQLFGTFDLV